MNANEVVNLMHGMVRVTIQAHAWTYRFGNEQKRFGTKGTGRVEKGLLVGRMEDRGWAYLRIQTHSYVKPLALEK